MKVKQWAGGSNESVCRCSTITLGNSLNFVLLLNGERVGLSDTLGGGDDFISEGLTHALEGSESWVSGTFAEEVDSLIDSSHWGNINSLSSDGTTWTNSGRVFSGTTLDDGLEQDLEWVLTGQKVNDFKGLLEDSDGHLLLTILSGVTNHELIDKSLGDWALDLLESLLLIFTSSIWGVHLSLDVLDWEVVNEGMFRALNVFVSPFSEKFWLNSKFEAVICIRIKQLS